MTLNIQQPVPEFSTGVKRSGNNIQIEMDFQKQSTSFAISCLLGTNVCIALIAMQFVWDCM